ncbi:DUF3841 domain-containing protein [Planctomycetota bacterium]
MATIRGWSVQPWTVWEQLDAEGSLTVDPSYVAEVHHAYEWLRPRLATHIPGYSGHYPWWAHIRRPDLRGVRHEKPAGERFALLELQLPRKLVVLLRFWAWDLIFYGYYLSATPGPSRTWHRRLKEHVPNEEDIWPLPSPWQEELEASWELLFDPVLPVAGWRPGGGPASHDVDIVFEKLDRSYVRTITSFLGARRSLEPRLLHSDRA